MSIVTKWNFNSNEIEVGFETLRGLKYNIEATESQLNCSIYKYICYNNDYGYNLVDEFDTVSTISEWFPKLLRDRLVELTIIGPKGNVIGRGSDFFHPSKSQIAGWVDDLASIYH